ncbi:hypothetical protein HYG93_10635 [Acinetobacter sp. SwsAc6]|jgi:hypothetical protein|uniref:Uncharacterized protein n=1 Tax=Acinetobacter cumulans TaxID=2136182 RepID=A0A498CZH9_9GAMM|nr:MULTISPECIES: hypothetical protein [Acinetobacter]NWK74731.1 hypothetical protein [Acinetobacter sp. SwsAc6]QCO21448.1 hypothetical protein C9E88_007955 [Acinetobacter cumulans]RKG42893.1 hypothetical protein D7V51_10810 [Acinetobacter cumulans]RLL37954.1 hypothetical protein D9K80_02715 [Acinetobacter cumulans]RZG58798.1 hypothetical protein EXE29_09685 [Acinetobacter sp. WCHAc060006]
MLNFLLWICVLIVLSVLWMVIKKIVKKQRYVERLKRYQAPEKLANISAQSAGQNDSITHVVDEYEQQLFDDVASMFCEQHYEVSTLDEAKALQAEILRKMPVTCKTQIRALDLDEYSIYWNFYEQSLEYYMGRYGVFYAHVDRLGTEHKREITKAPIE